MNLSIDLQKKHCTKFWKLLYWPFDSLWIYFIRVKLSVWYLSYHQYSYLSISSLYSTLHHSEATAILHRPSQLVVISRYICIYLDTDTLSEQGTTDGMYLHLFPNIVAEFLVQIWLQQSSTKCETCLNMWFIQYMQ